MNSDAPRQDAELEVVIPLYNEEDIVRESVLTLKRHLDHVTGGIKWRFILVDNGCPYQNLKSNIFVVQTAQTFH